MHQDNVKVREVLTRHQLRAFLRVPWKIYSGDPHWVPPLIKEQALLFSSPTHPFRRHAEIAPFLATIGTKVVGRIAAIVDDNYARHHDRNTGFFGFFECCNDVRVAQRLIHHAKEWLRRRGMDTLMGPLSPSTNDECGLLIDGFDSDPFLLMAHNPPYYQDLLEQCGLEKAKDLFANLVVNQGTIPERILRIREAVTRRTSNVNVRRINLKDIKHDAALVREIYTEAWQHNWGFVPPTDEEMTFMVTRLKSLVDPDLVLFAEIEGRTVGFALAMPNYNLVFKRLNGRLGIMGFFKFLYYSRKIDEMRIMMLGVRPEYRKRGIETLLYVEIFRKGMAKGYKRGEMSWILEDNHLMQRAIEALGGQKYKTYRIFQCSL